MSTYMEETNRSIYLQMKKDIEYKVSLLNEDIKRYCRMCSFFFLLIFFLLVFFFIIVSLIPLVNILSINIIMFICAIFITIMLIIRTTPLYMHRLLILSLLIKKGMVSTLKSIFTCHEENITNHDSISNDDSITPIIKELIQDANLRYNSKNKRIKQICVTGFCLACISVLFWLGVKTDPGYSFMVIGSILDVISLFCIIAAVVYDNLEDIQNIEVENKIKQLKELRSTYRSNLQTNHEKYKNIITQSNPYLSNISTSIQVDMEKGQTEVLSVMTSHAEKIHNTDPVFIPPVSQPPPSAPPISIFSSIIPTLSSVASSDLQSNASSEGDICAICLFKKRDSLFMPCRHLATCYQCGKLCDKCPICMEPGNLIPIYIS